MRDWNNFHGCEKLSDVECIDFLKHLEDSKRIDTEEGSFLHNQYIRELMNKRGLSVRTLDPTHGAMNYYNLQSLTNKHDDVNKSMHPGMCKGYALMSIRADIKAVEEPYIPLQINGLQACLNQLHKILSNTVFISDIANLIANNKYAILLVGDEDLLSKNYRDSFIKYDINLGRVVRRWCNRIAIEEHTCGNDVYIYGIENIRNLSFLYKWRGYCVSCGVISGESKTGESWVNKEKERYEI
jgi:hypothetical protein